MEFLGYDYVNPITIRNNQPTFTSDTQSLKLQSVRTGAQRWELQIGFRGGIKENMYGTFLSHFLVNGSTTSFDLEIPQIYDTEGPATDSAIAAAGAIAATVITLSSAADVFQPGYLFKFSNHNKVYMVTAQSGVNLSFQPGLVDGVAATDTIDNTSPMMKVYHAGTNTSVTTQNDGTQSLSWTFIEAL